MRLTPDQFRAITRAHYGLIPRPPKSEVPSVTKWDYPYVYDRWSAFDRWKAWRDTGGPRPSTVWKVVPKWDGYTPWDLLLEIRAKWPITTTKPMPVPHPTTPPFSTARGQSWFVIAQEYQNAWVGPNWFGRAFVADPAYPHPSRYEIEAYASRGIRTATWGDSREGGDGTTPQMIVDLANEIRTDFVMFQAERIDECVSSLKMMDKLGGDQHLLIVNLASIAADENLYKDLSARIQRGNVLAIVECYKNCGWGGPDWRGLPCASTLGATYADGQCGGCSMETYYQNGWIAPHRDSWYTAQWTADMYANAR